MRGTVGRVVVRALGESLVALAAGLMGAVVGLLMGATYGGNFARDFEFDGFLGYEATGRLGAVLGFVVGGGLAVFLRQRTRNKPT
jgi:hypothetical protein